MQKLERILYAEDEPDIQKIASIALEMIGGVSLEICNNGLEALAKIDNFKPQLLLLDVMMPAMDGPSTFKKIREIPTYQNIPTVFMTAKVQPSEVQEYLEMGAIDVISKPFDPVTLAAQIQAIWQRSQA